MRRWLLAVCAISVLASACGTDTSTEASITAPPDDTPFATAETAETVRVLFGEDMVTTEIAASPGSRARGLMNRRELGADAGMLFLFPQPDTGGFWMKNTLIPLQIAYMRRAGRATFEVLALRDMVPCTADPCTVYDPGLAYEATLEVNESWFDRHGVEVGSRATVEGELPDPM